MQYATAGISFFASGSAVSMAGATEIEVSRDRDGLKQTKIIQTACML
jgi:hypothetical protein